MKHLSGSPSLKGAGEADFSRNTAGLNGKYFLENATFDADINFDRNVIHYYGYNSDDTIIDKRGYQATFYRIRVQCRNNK